MADEWTTWADRTGAYSPDYYAYRGSNETSEQIRETFAKRLGQDAAIIELGCSAGRHLAHLGRAGFQNLTGIDINQNSISTARKAYPDLARVATFHEERIENVISEFDNGAFDAVFTVETLQHLPPESTWVFPELARITDELLVTVENEGDVDGDEVTVTHVHGEIPLYHRDWGHVFRAVGMEQVACILSERDTMRVFSV